MVTIGATMNDIKKEQQKEFDRSRMVATRAHMNDSEKERQKV